MADEKQPESTGLGDTIKKITTAIGVRTCTPCQKRAEALNRRFPYKPKQ